VVLGAAAAEAAWLISCSHSAEELPLTSMPEPLSSISTSSASESSDWTIPSSVEEPHGPLEPLQLGEKLSHVPDRSASISCSTS
jgi:hypothetical protein